jgi:dephospho-CoA kinase
MRIGLTGGIGSGKSEVARIFERMGALVIDTDLLARDAVAPQSDGLREIARVWPRVVRDGALDRAALADIIFADPNARERLNGIVHPHVRRLALQRERFAKPGQPIVQVIPLLFETGLDKKMDKNVVVIAPDEERIARAMLRDGSDESSVRARIAAQIDPNLARERADYVIENDADLARLEERARSVFESLVEGR